MAKSKDELRSRNWFADPDDHDMTALYIERYMNWGLSREELQSGKPIIGIAQTGSDLSPCNRHHIILAERIREGIREAGGIAFEFPVHPIQETGKRPTANLDRNLAYLGLVETLFGYPIDGVVLTIGCDKTTPALLMAAATANIPAIAFSVGPMLNGWYKGQRTGSGTIKWHAKKELSAGNLSHEEYTDIVASSAPSPGYCNTMGTATTMNSLAEALGMSLPGSASIPAVHKERAVMAYLSGKRIVDMVWEDMKPSDIMTREAFENAIAANSAIGGSTNAPIHLKAIANHLGVELTNDDWEKIGYDIPLLLDLQPAGQFLGEDYHHAGGLPSVLYELLQAERLPHPDAMTVNGKSIGQNCIGKETLNREVIHPFDKPMLEKSGFLNLKGNLFDTAIMKTSVISDEFRQRFLSKEGDENAFEGRAVVFDGREDYHARINDPSLEIDEHTLLVMRGAGPIGYPGGAEIVNMQPPDALIKRGIGDLPCIGDGRQSGTSGSPSILNAAPEAAIGGGLALVETGDILRIDLNERTANILVSDEVLAARKKVVAEKLAKGRLDYVPDHQTPWQEIQRDIVDQFDEGMVLKPAVKYRNVTTIIPRHNH
jgi:dihydroxy-acid dehydratase